MALQNGSASCNILENGGIRVNVNSQSTLDWEFTDFEDKLISLNILSIVVA